MTPELFWRDWRNAEIYNGYVHEFSIYRELNRRLVELARIATARRVLDLASGSGATALTCLRHMAPDAELVGLDASEAMISLARSQIRDSRARFEVAPAEGVLEAVSGRFDRVVSNAAFWQLADPDAVIAHLGALLEEGGLFVFNVPAELVLGEPSGVHALQIALAGAIESETGRAFSSRNPPVLDPHRLAERLDEAGLELERRERFVYRGRQRELTELMRIPAMIGPLTPDLSPETRQTVLDLAERRTDPEEWVEVPWIYFTARRTGGDGERS